jgi:sugar O-acyltransferase (sialic acid O-acetyltransferase NeuD family)
MTATEVILIGAGDHGRGTLEIIRALNALSARYTVLGYLDDAPGKDGTHVDGVPVIGGLQWIETHHRDALRYVIALADSAGKQRIAGRLDRLGVRYETVVHPSVVLSTGVRLGEGVTIGAGVVVAHDTVIGAHVTLNLNSTVGHDCLVGRFVTVSPGANIAGRVQLGEGCEVGLNAAVGRGTRIGDWAHIGPGAVVVKSVPPGQRAFGNPARLVPTSAASS